MAVGIHGSLIILEKNTGKYGIKLGCHPDFGVAMERTFYRSGTRTGDIYQYSGRSIIDFIIVWCRGRN